MDAANLIAELNGKFKSESISFGTWKDSSLPTAFISNQYCKGAVSPYGAHVLSYVPNGEKDLIMVSELSAYEPPKAIRGGVPVCWPWFGPAAKPMHGVARIQYWNMTAVRKESDGSDTVVFSLSICEPHRLDAVFEVNFGAKLSMKLITVNQGDSAYSLGGALHTYFSVGEIEKVTISGLGGSTYCDRAGGGNIPGCLCKGDFGFTAESDNIYASNAAVTIIDPVFDRKILVEKSGSEATVVWNPWVEKSKLISEFRDDEYHVMVCVEAANCGDDIIDLKPGMSHTLTQTISLVR